MLITLACAVVLSAAPEDAAPATPVVLFVETIKADPERMPQARVWTQILAQQLRRWGANVTTQEDLAAAMSGNRQQQQLGCEDRNCGLDADVLKEADGLVSGTFAGEGPYVVSLRVMHNQAGPWSCNQPWVMLIGRGSFSDPLEAINEMVPQLIEGMKRDLGPGRVRDRPMSEKAVGGPPSASPRRCELALAPALALLAALWVRRRFAGVR
ncbi:MAG: hypothetical protein IPJ65_06730 [Archangiaceae bacterium]|nr:hypothetical protein [Archangiaceae bacterium]